MESSAPNPNSLLERALASERIHSAYLLSGDPETVTVAALTFARGLVCRGEGPRPCEDCRDCRRSDVSGNEPVELDGSGKRGPLFRHVGDHPDLYWIDRGSEGTRVRIGQVRAVQQALRFGSNEGGWCAAVVADAERLNEHAQNSLLKLLEEPPPRTCLILASADTASLKATIRSRCQRVRFPPARGAGIRDPEADSDQAKLVARFDRIAGYGLPELLDWAEEYRGNRAHAAEQVEGLLFVGGEWIREHIRGAVDAGRRDLRKELGAFSALSQCRKDLVQRNANPQMVAERALFAVRTALSNR